MGWPFIQGTIAFWASFSILCCITAKIIGTRVESHFEINFAEVSAGTHILINNGVSYLSLGSSTSADSRGSGRSSSTPVGSTDSSICRRAWWAEERPGWSTALSASLQQTAPLLHSHSCFRQRNHRIFRLTVHDELDFTIRVPRCVTSSINGAEVDTIIPPHHLSDDQISLCGHARGMTWNESSLHFSGSMQIVLNTFTDLEKQPANTRHWIMLFCVQCNHHFSFKTFF